MYLSSTIHSFLKLNTYVNVTKVVKIFRQLLEMEYLYIMNGAQWPFIVL